MAFSVVLTVFTSLFIRDPCLCFGRLCNIPSWDFVLQESDYYSDVDIELVYCSDRTFKKLPFLKILLSCAVAIFVTNIVFIFVYITIFIRRHQQQRQGPLQISNTGKLLSDVFSKKHNRHNTVNRLTIQTTISEPVYCTVDADLPEKQSPPISPTSSCVERF